MRRHTSIGLTAAFTIIVLWAVSLLGVLSIDFRGSLFLLAIPLIPLMTFLYTGLFITAHDAMHALVAPRNRILNNGIGTLCSIAYALFSFERLKTEHWKHHREPASDHDPDYHDGAHPGFFRWYLHFLARYVTWRQILGMAIAFNVLKYAFAVPDFNLIALWILPNLLSTLQLFLFGTYLPHREPEKGYDNPHRARSSNYSALLSFFSCYHFGYHYEHHRYPHVPWWDLPRVRHETRADLAAGTSGKE